MPKTLSLTEAKAKLSELVGDVADQQERVIVTRNGRPAAVLISPDDLESLEETLAEHTPRARESPLATRRHTPSRTRPQPTAGEGRRRHSGGARRDPGRPHTPGEAAQGRARRRAVCASGSVSDPVSA